MENTELTNKIEQSINNTMLADQKYNIKINFDFFDFNHCGDCFL